MIFDKAPMPVVKGDSLRVVCRANLWLYQSVAIHRVQPPPTIRSGEVVESLPGINVTSMDNSSVGGIDELGYEIPTTELPGKSLSYEISYSRWASVRQVPEGSGEQGKMEKTGCKIICGAPTTLTVKGLMMMMMMMSISNTEVWIEEFAKKKSGLKTKMESYQGDLSSGVTSLSSGWLLVKAVSSGWSATKVVSLSDGLCGLCHLGDFIRVASWGWIRNTQRVKQNAFKSKKSRQNAQIWEGILFFRASNNIDSKNKETNKSLSWYLLGTFRWMCPRLKKDFLKTNSNTKV